MDLLQSPNFPRASKYNPEWILSSVSGGANSLWLTEWLSEVVTLKPGMRVLDLGAGRGAASIFLHREFGVQVYSVDLWFSATERLQRVRDAQVEGGVIPLHADARALPFPHAFFDAIISIDSFVYYGTDDLFLSSIARYVKPGGQLAIAGAGLMRELDEVPEHLRGWWEPSLWCLHSPAWWARHWGRTGLVDVEHADAMPDGWKAWLAWQQAASPGNEPEISALQADQGRTLGYVRAVARRRPDAQLEDPISTVPVEYRSKPLLRP